VQATISGTPQVQTVQRLGAYSQGENDPIRPDDAFFRKSGKVIVPLTVNEILNEQLARKLA
jgi:hypothetical protein